MIRNTAIIYLTVLFCIAFQSTNFAQKPNYTGTWELNLKKSKLESRPEGLTSSVFIIKQQGDEFNFTRNHIFGEKKKKINFVLIADGKARRLKLIYKGKLLWKGNNLEATLWRSNSVNVVNYRFGNNRNELIADEIFTGNPRKHRNIWVFDRKT